MEQQDLNCIVKEPYYNHFIHLISFGSIWIVASFIGAKHYENIAIILLFAGTCLFNPIFQMVRKAFSLCPIHCDDPLRTITTCITIALPIGIVICFLPFLENINAFFYVFGILFGIVFMIVAFIYNLKRYYILGGLLIIGEAILLSVYDSFSIGGFFAGGALMAFGIIVKIFGDTNTLQNKQFSYQKAFLKF